MDQTVLAGVGNVYRAEVLFRHRIDPLRPGNTLRRGQFTAMWDDLVELMAEGVRTGRIDTVRPEHTPEAMGRAPRVDDHGGEVYVYRRDGRACHVCGATVRTEVLQGRNLFWCPGCQRTVPLAGRTVSPPDDEDRTTMTALREPSRPARTPGLRPPRTSGIRTTWRSSLRRSSARENWVVLSLAVLAVVLTAAMIVWPDTMPISALVLPLTLASLTLPPRQLPWFVVFVLLLLMVSLLGMPKVEVRTVLTVLTLFVLSFIILLTSFRRSRLGVAGVLGESMLVDLRDRILGQGVIPQLPEPWYVESALRSAGGTPFAGDFVVTSMSSTADAPRHRRRRRVRQGGAGRHPGPAALGGVRGPAHGAAAGRLPAGRQRLPAPPGLGGGLRDRDPPHPRPRHRAPSRSAPPGTRPRSTSPPGRGVGRPATPRARSWA